MGKDRVRVLLAFNMKRLRNLRGLTGDELAEKADLTGGYIRQVETHKAWASPKTLDSIARALRVPIHELFLDKRNLADFKLIK